MSNNYENIGHRPLGRPRTVDEITRRENNRIDQQRFRYNRAKETQSYNDQIILLISKLLEANQKTQDTIRDSFIALTNKIGILNSLL
jgi:hypothetical protein